MMPRHIAQKAAMAMTITVFKFKEESKGEKKRAICNIVYEITGTFRTEYENEIEYENDFPISNQSHPQNSRSFLLFTIR